MMMMMMIIIALKGTIQDFFLYNLLTAQWTVSNTYALVARAQPCANHEQHVCIFVYVCTGVQHVCHVVRRDSSTNKFDRFEIPFILALFYWLKPSTDEGGEETRVPGKIPDKLHKMPHTKAQTFKPQPRLEPVLKHWWQARNADVLTTTPRVTPETKGELLWYLSSYKKTCYS